MAYNGLKTVLHAGLACALSCAALAWGEPALAAPDQQAAGQEAQQQAAQEGYLFESKRYGYRIICPTKPSYMPASILYAEAGTQGKKDAEPAPSKQGDVLIFEDSYSQTGGYAIKHAWVILTNEDSSNVPDFDKLTEQEATEYLEKLQRSNGFEGIELVKLLPDNAPSNTKVIYAVTAKEIEIDEDGDGVTDATATADTQEMMAFFRTRNGRYLVARLIDNPRLRKESVENFQLCLATLEDLGAPAAVQPAAGAQAAADSPKDKEKKPKKQKNSK